MHIKKVRTFEDLEEYLRTFANFSGDPLPYDFVGTFHLILAVLDNLAGAHLDADIESLEECDFRFSDPQVQFLRKLQKLE